jgi:Leucine-rich repeat (LRR) protein
MKNLLLVIVLFVSTGIVFSGVSQKEKDALLDLYATTNGENWVNIWDLRTPVDTWYGITVKDNTVVAINLLFNNLDGLLPDSLEDLKNLEKLELSFNKLTGTIPATVGSLQKLKVFAVNGNNLRGTIPASFGKLQNIKEIHLSSNQLEGNIPASIGMLKSLEVLNLFDNNLEGILPHSLAANESLKELVIAKNHITTTEAFADVLVFKHQNESFKISKNLVPTKTVLATEINDDN